MIEDSGFYTSLLNEYPNLNEADLRYCIDISTTEYFSEKKAFMVKDRIYILQNSSIHRLDRNTFRATLLKPLVAKNFQLMNKVRSLKISPKFIKYRNIVFYGRKDFENDEFIIYSLFFNRELLPFTKVIIFKKDYLHVKNSILLLQRDIVPITIDIQEFKKDDDIFVFKGELMNENIVRHELSITVSKLNRELSKKLSYNLEVFNTKKAEVVIKFHKLINKQTQDFIKNRLQKKICLNTIFRK